MKRIRLTKSRDDLNAMVADQRRAAYPPVEDLADAIYWQSKGDDAPMKIYLAKVEAVKARLPKAN